MSRIPAKRVDIVKIKMVKEKSILYENRKVNSPTSVVDIINDFTKGSDREMVIAIYLNTQK